ncbi:unnamed protein product [Parnassius mnemosyne]|uniref:Uncharacterized protein n=1 Tax=Parnassius mnemosyne TaxID=213953 RepID=A0AAV1LH50_9NEOP
MVDVNLNHSQKNSLLSEDFNKNVTSAENVSSHPVICKNEKNIETHNNEIYEDKGVDSLKYLEVNINSEQVNKEKGLNKNEYNNNNSTNDDSNNNSTNDNNNSNDINSPTISDTFKYESLCNPCDNDINGCVDTDVWNQNCNNIPCPGLNSSVLSEYFTTLPLSYNVQNNIMPVLFDGFECEKDKDGDIEDNKLKDDNVDNDTKEVICNVRSTGHCTKSFECVENSYLNSFIEFIEELKNVNKEADEIASVSSISEHCSGYQSSDFEFIDEDEAKEAMFVTKRISSIETLKENINFDFKFNDECEAKMKVCVTKEIPTVENREETNSFNPDAQNAISFNYLQASSSRSVMYNRNTIYNTDYQRNINYQQNHVIPEGDDFLNLFQGAHVPSFESRFFENKSIFARNPTSSIKHIGFDIRLLLEGNKQYISENDVREAKETENKILSLYPEENRDYHRKI